MAVYFPSTTFDLDAIALPMSKADRLKMEHFIEAAIALLDLADGDVDLEDDELNDDPIDAFGEALGYSEAGLCYGVDQSLGPIGCQAK